MWRWLLAAAVSLLSSPSIAQFNGPYLGGHLGYSNFDVGARFTATAPASGFVADTSADDPIFGVFGGYGRTFQIFGQQIYLGLEGEYSRNTAHGTVFARSSGPDAFAVEMTVTDSYGVTSRIGIVPLPQFLVYARFGWQWSLIELKARSPFGTARTSGFINGLRVGAGTEWAIFPNFLLGIEWTYTFYGDFGGPTYQVAIPGAGLQLALSQVEKGESRLALRATWVLNP
jgi:opacity protein-like surface antigen